MALTKDQLRRCEQAGRRLSLLSSIFFWERDLKTNFTYVSESCLAVLGYSADELVGSRDSWLGIMHPADRQWVPDFSLSETKAGRPYECQYRVRSADGRWLWLREKAEMVHDENEKLVGSYGYLIDVTAAKVIEQRLSETETRYRIASSLTRNAVWDWDLLTNRLLWNEGISSLFLFPVSVMNTDIFFWYGNIHPDDRVAIVNEVNAAIDSRQEYWRGTYRFRTGQGSYRHVQDNMWIFRNEEGVPTRAIGAISDISDRMRVEKERDRLLVEMQEAKSEAEKALKIRSQLLRSTSYDLKNSLSTILMNLGLLNRMAQKQEGGAALKPYLSQTKESAERISSLLEDMSMVAKGEFGELELRVEQISPVHVLLEEARDRVQHMLTNENIKIEIRSDDQDVRLLGDRTLLGQALFKLLNFVIRHSPKETTVILQEDYSEGEEILRLCNSAWRLSQDSLRALFQGRQSDLDFAVAETIIRAHGGRVRVQSTNEFGTVISLTVPSDVSRTDQIKLVS